MIKRYSKKRDGNKNITRNIKVNEVACPLCDEVIIDYDVVVLAQCVRRLTNAPIYITDGYRNYEYNKQVGGITNSPHLRGLALDTYSKKYNIDVLACIYELCGAGSVLYYQKSKFIHVDTRKNGYYCTEEPYSFVYSYCNRVMVEKVQTYLKDLKLYNSDVDGLIGANTINGFKHFCLYGTLEHRKEMIEIIKENL